MDKQPLCKQLEDASIHHQEGNHYPKQRRAIFSASVPTLESMCLALRPVPRDQVQVLPPTIIRKGSAEEAWLFPVCSTCGVATLLSIRVVLILVC